MTGKLKRKEKEGEKMETKESMIAELINRNNIILDAYRRYTEGKISGITYDGIFKHHKERIDSIIKEMRVKNEK